MLRWRHQASVCLFLSIRFVFFHSKKDPKDENSERFAYQDPFDSDYLKGIMDNLLLNGFRWSPLSSAEARFDYWEISDSSTNAMRLLGLFTSGIFPITIDRSSRLTLEIKDKGKVIFRQNAEANWSVTYWIFTLFPWGKSVEDRQKEVLETLADGVVYSAIESLHSECR